MANKHRDTQPQAVPVPRGNARVSKRGPDPNNPCKLIPYGLLACPKVKDANGDDTDVSEQSHHVVADRAFRSTSRPSGLWDQTGYISGMSQGAGLAMCLEGNASNPTSPHGIATQRYEQITRAAANNGMVRLGVAEAAGALGIQDTTKGRCKAPDILAQLRAYHQALGLSPDTWVRQSTDPLGSGHTPALGSR